MRKIIRYYKPYILSLIVIIALLAVRAQSELKLPDYMSNIVDIGISGNGVDSPLPEAIRPQTLESLAALMQDEDADALRAYYRLLERDVLTSSEYNNYVKKYPILAESAIYVLDKTDKNAVQQLELPAADAFLKLTGGAALAALQMPESARIQAAYSFAAAELKALGVDMNWRQINYILRNGGMMLLVLLVIMAAILGETFLASRMAAGIARSLRRDVFTRVTAFSNAEFDKFSTASLITRSTNDIQHIQIISFLFLRFVVFSPMLGVGAVLKVIDTGAGMTWIISLSVLAVLVLVTVIFSAVTPKFKVMQKFVDRLNLVSRESLTGVMVVRAFNMESFEEQKFDKANKDLKGLGLFVNRVFSMMNPVMSLALNGTTLLIIWIGSGLVNGGTLQIGVMMAFLQYAMQIINSFMMLTMITMNLPRALVSVNRVSEVLSTDSSVQEPADGGTKQFNSKLKGVVEFKEVSFKYPGAEEYVLKDVSFTAKPGETTAFIGSTGSGKSSVINLIPRFYDATGGQILVEGVDVKKIKTRELRKKIGYVPQQGLLFTGTIESNIKFGDSADRPISDKDMELAAEIAQARNFIDEKPEGFRESIAQAGVNVSGGQKQRLSIARAVAGKPAVFIFDDSFSALDYKTDASLRRAISEKLSDATMLVVAQRIGTIKNAAQIIVLDEGIVVGKGTHKELLNSCPVYRQIALSQLSPKELEMDENNGKAGA